MLICDQCGEKAVNTFAHDYDTKDERYSVRASVYKGGKSPDLCIKCQREIAIMVFDKLIEGKNVEGEG